MRVQIPDVPYSGYFHAEIRKEVRLIRMVVGASAVRVLGLRPRAGNVAYLEAISLGLPEEGHGEFKVIEPLRMPQDLGVDAILQRQSLLHWSYSLRYAIAQRTQFAKVLIRGFHGLSRT